MTTGGRIAGHLRAHLAMPFGIAVALADGLATAACVGGLALLMLAQPAFRDVGPGWLKRLELSVTFYDREGREIGRRGIRHDDRTRLADLPPHLVAAVLATEDRRFFRHHGIDPLGLLRALAANAEADGIVQGGSTLTQQLAKNLFLNGERTLERKIREAFLAVWLEWNLTKPEILKLYLDRAYLGGGTFGMEAAAQFYFGKSAREIDLSEAAMLAGMLKAPSRYAPHAHPGASAARAAEVLDRMLEAGAIDAPTRDATKRAPAAAITRDVTRQPGFYLDWAFREVQRLAAAGWFAHDAALAVTTPFDAALQRSTEAAIETALDRDGGRLAVGQGAMVVMDPDGAVRAMVGGRDYETSQFNRATSALRQPGSSFKPFVYAAALARTEFRPGSLVSDREICIGSWCPSNYSRSFSGSMSLRDALAASINTVAVRLSVEIGRAAGEMTVSRQARHGRARITEVARALGITTTLHDTPSLPLGASEVRLLDMTAAYAGFANGGIRAEPHAILSVANTRGDELYRRERDEAAPRRALAPEIAGEMNDMLARVVAAGTARRAALPGQIVAGKTGTTSAYRDAWFVGFTAHLVGGVWLGNDDYTSTRQVTGGTLPASIWHAAMRSAHLGLPSKRLPPGDGLEGREVASLGRIGGFAEVAGSARAGRRGFEVVPSTTASFGAR